MLSSFEGRLTVFHAKDGLVPNMHRLDFLMQTLMAYCLALIQFCIVLLVILRMLPHFCLMLFQAILNASYYSHIYSFSPRHGMRNKTPFNIS